jgi:hypothetical protein
MESLPAIVASNVVLLVIADMAVCCNENPNCIRRLEELAEEVESVRYRMESRKCVYL